MKEASTLDERMTWDFQELRKRFPGAHERRFETITFVPEGRDGNRGDGVVMK